MTATAPVPRLIEQFEHGLDAPICLTWELTYACNLSCVHCLSSSGKRDPRELSTQQCKDIIDELEREKRGLYAGCVGYFSADGAMDTCIALRTAVIKDGKMYVQAGAGIVADSVPASEQAECVNKAKALFRAAEEAVRFAHSAKKGQ